MGDPKANKQKKTQNNSDARYPMPLIASNLVADVTVSIGYRAYAL